MKEEISLITVFVLFGSFALLMILSRIGILFRHETNRGLAAFAMAIFLIFFGISHFFLVNEMILMIPKIFPYPDFIVYATGVIEIVLAIGLIIPKTRRLSGIFIALYFIAVFPVNIVKAMSDIDIQGTFNSPIMSWVRLLFQPIFILWALYCSKTDNDGFKVRLKMQGEENTNV